LANAIVLFAELTRVQEPFFNNLVAPTHIFTMRLGMLEPFTYLRALCLWLEHDSLYPRTRAARGRRHHHG